MQKIEVSKLSKIIARNGKEDIREINLAIKEINEILELEEVRKTQIKNKLKEVSIPTSIAKLENHLREIKNNLECLNLFSKILNSKKIIALNELKNELDISEKIDFSKATPLARFF
jgi:DNA-binding transcriptional MerR regulator